MRKKAFAWALALTVVAVVILTFGPGASSAKTPDGMPPSQETVCSGLQGAAFGLCNAYCEAQDCDVHPRPSCAQLLRNFRRITGMPAFPCDSRCGDGTIDRNEDCDPPGSVCPDERRLCSDDCTCPEPFCGDGIVDAGEQCDPASPLSVCPCRPDCTCASTEPRCCECADGCITEPATGCPTDCASLPGLVCGAFTGQCEPSEPSCCDCGAGAACFDANTPGDCVMQGCTPVPNFSCSPNGCVGFGPAE
jgi:hypothetical protein